MSKLKPEKVFASLNSENGSAALEAPVAIFILMLLISFIYEFLKYQHDIAMIYYSEQIAVSRVNVADLKDKSSSIPNAFLGQLKESSEGPFDAIDYSNVVMTCQDKNFNKVSCNQYSRIIRFSYLARREYINVMINDFFSLPVTLNREVYLFNDYYY